MKAMLEGPSKPQAAVSSAIVRRHGGTQIEQVYDCLSAGFEPFILAGRKKSERTATRGSPIGPTYPRRLAMLLRVPGNPAGNLSTARRPPSGAVESSTEPP